MTIELTNLAKSVETNLTEQEIFYLFEQICRSEQNRRICESLQNVLCFEKAKEVFKRLVYLGRCANAISR